MTVALIALVVALVGAMGVIVWLVHLNNQRVDQTIVSGDALNAAHKEVTDKTVEAERAKYEMEKANQAFISEQARANALEEFIGHAAKTKDPNADLAVDDVDGRVFRLSQKWGGVVSSPTSTGGKVPPVASGEVHTDGPTKVP